MYRNDMKIIYANLRRKIANPPKKLMFFSPTIPRFYMKVIIPSIHAPKARRYTQTRPPIDRRTANLIVRG